jgi:hypothetical protein
MKFEINSHKQDEPVCLVLTVRPSEALAISKAWKNKVTWNRDIEHADGQDLGKTLHNAFARVAGTPEW